MKTNIIFFLIIFLSSVNVAQSENYFGVQTHFGQFYRGDMDSLSVCRMLDSIQSAGIKIIRDECYWSDIELTKGVFTFPKEIDLYVSEAKARGIDVLLILDYNNSLYGSSSAITTDSNRQAYARYCQEVVTRYSPLGVKHYEIWNEPNIPIFWSPTPNAEQYFELLKVAYPAIKSVDSTVVVLGCATSPAEGNPYPYIDWLTFINSVFSYGGGNYMDGVSFHIYKFGTLPEDFIFNYISNLQAIVGINKSLWITELGYPTSKVWPNISLDDQTNFLTRLYLLGKNVEQLKSLIYYDLKNDCIDDNNNECNFGLLKYDLSSKPAFNSIKTLISKISDKELAFTNINGLNYMYTFSNGTDSVIAVWHKSASATNTLNFNKNKIQITDSYNNSQYFYDIDKSLQITFEKSPKYISELDSFPKILNFEISPTIDTLVIGQKVKFKLTGNTNNSELIFIENEAFQWSFSNSNAVVDSIGQITALNEGSGFLIADFEGNLFQKEFVIIPDYDCFEIESFNDTNNFSYMFTNILPATMLSIVDTNYTTPNNSLLIDYHFQYQAINSHKITFTCDYWLYGEPDTLNLDIYNNSQPHAFEFHLNDADDQAYKINAFQIPATDGWYTLKKSLNNFGSTFNYPCKLTKIILYLVQNGAIVGNIYSGSILLDNLGICNDVLSLIDHKNEQVNEFQLFQNYPNPFNPTTMIKYSIAIEGLVELKIYNILGEEITTLINENKNAGNYSIEFNGQDLSSGVYFYRIKSGKFTEIKKMILMK